MKKAIVSVSNYMELVSNMHHSYPVGNYLNPISRCFLYRGVSDKHFTLLPSVLRKQTDKVCAKQEIENHKYTTFESERSILASFILEASGYIDIPPNDLFRWAEYAQHFGVPTRYLDWTSNPLVALFFACIEKHNSDGAVWLLNFPNYGMLNTLRHISDKELSQLSKRDVISQLLEGTSKCELPVLYQPCYVNLRMSAQSSYFMVWGIKQDTLEGLLKGHHSEIDLTGSEYLKISSKEKGEEPKPVLFKTIVPASCKQKLLRELDLVGINEKTLFPGLDGIGRYVERKYRLNYDEFLMYESLL